MLTLFFSFMETADLLSVYRMFFLIQTCYLQYIDFNYGSCPGQFVFSLPLIPSPRLAEKLNGKPDHWATDQDVYPRSTCLPDQLQYSYFKCTKLNKVIKNNEKLNTHILKSHYTWDFS